MTRNRFPLLSIVMLVSVLLALCLWLIVDVPAARVLAQVVDPTASDTTGLFAPAATPLMKTVQPCRSTIPRSRYVTVNRAQFEQSTTLNLNLFDEVSFTAVNTGKTPRPSGQPGYVWSGTLAGIPFSSVTLVVSEHQVSGRISIPGSYYTLHPVEGAPGIYELAGYETTAEPIAYVPVSTASPLTLPGFTPRLDDGSQLDILVVYTPGAKSILERVVGDVDTAVDEAIVHTNQIFTASGINTRLHLVHLAPVFYLEQPNVEFDADLKHLMGKTDGYMDEVHTLRDQYGADLVAMISGVWFASYAGIAPAPAPLDEARGFSITEACNIQDTTFTRQIGHNLGSTLDAANAADSPVNPYGYGYQDPSTGGGDYGDFVTVMGLRTGGECPPIVTAGKCPIVERFSDPNATYNGKPLGSVTANNVQSINELALTVASYRQSENIPPTDIPTEPVELLINGSFEIDADKDRVPDFWKSTGFGTGDRQKCKGSVYAGSCALVLKGAPGENSRLDQSVTLGGVKAGDTLDFAARTAGFGVSTGGQIRLTVTFADDTKYKLKLDVPPGTYDFTLMAGGLEMDKDGKQAKVQIRFKNPAASGKFRVDAVSLTTATPAGRLPLP